MGRSVIGGDYAAGLNHQAGKPLRGLHGNLAHGALGQTFGGLQHQGFTIVIQQIDRADVAIHPLGHNGDDVVQGFVKIMGVENDTADIFEGT